MMNPSEAHSNDYGLIVISAPSGAGKSTLCGKLLNEFSSELALSISSTTRAPRGNEKHGEAYFFITREAFIEKINENAFAEWASVHENYYGTLKSTLEHFWNSKKHVLLDIDVQGAASLKKNYGNRCCTIFIAPPSLEVLEQRLRGRGTDTEAAIQKRMANAMGEMNRQNEFEIILVNDDLNLTYEKLRQVVLEKIQSWRTL